MKQRKTTARNIKVWADLNPELLAVVDAECQRLGGCSRASIFRMVLNQWAAAKATSDNARQVA